MSDSPQRWRWKHFGLFAFSILKIWTITYLQSANALAVIVEIDWNVSKMFNAHHTFLFYLFCWILDSVGYLWMVFLFGLFTFRYVLFN